MSFRQPKVRGFTLLETILAMAVVGIGVGALLSSVTFYTRQSAVMNEQLWAQFVAWNELTKLHITSEANRNVETRSFRTELLSFDWYIRQSSKEVLYDGVNQVDIVVGPSEDANSARMSILVYK